MVYNNMERIMLYIVPELLDKSGVDGIATVDSPAIEESWIAFNKKEPKRYIIPCGFSKGNFKPAEVEGDKQILAGALMVPNMDILRVDDSGKEYNVNFTPETIKQIVAKFSEKGINKSINQMHDQAKPVNGFLLQHFIIDRKSGVMPPFNQDHLVDGTWYGYVKINDTNLWNQFIKTGIYTGFSVEGFFYEEPEVTLSKEDIELLETIK